MIDMDDDGITPVMPSSLCQPCNSELLERADRMLAFIDSALGEWSIPTGGTR